MCAAAKAAEPHSCAFPRPLTRRQITQTDVRPGMPASQAATWLSATVMLLRWLIPKDVFIYLETESANERAAAQAFICWSLRTWPRWLGLLQGQHMSLEFLQGLLGGELEGLGPGLRLPSAALPEAHRSHYEAVLWEKMQVSGVKG